GNTATPIGFAGFSGVNIAQQVIDQPASDASIVRHPALVGLGISMTSIGVRVAPLLDNTVSAADMASTTGQVGANDNKAAPKLPLETTLPKAALLAQDIRDVPVGIFIESVPDTLPVAKWRESGLLDQTSGTAILVNRDAAGYGWFVDTSPAESGLRLKAGGGH